MTIAFIELRARSIYDAMPFDEPGEKPAWVEGGNSFKQDEARQQARFELATADDDGFIDWNGGPCPLPKSCKVDVQFHDGRVEYGYLAGMWSENVDWWQHKSRDGDNHITGYRLADDEDYEVATAAAQDTADERPLSETTHLFVGKTIERMDATCCNNVEFLFTDGTRVALHIDCDSMGLPSVDTCTTCVAITKTSPLKSEYNS